ncbi:MAG: hypothetical protein JKY31_11320 [Rhodobacteraceae bacterium]|nr:hypothetical protein [Paracoccaceae bacterium]
MKKTSSVVAAFLFASTAMVTAGGIDRSGQSVDIIFEDGSYAEISFGFVNPNISGEGPLGNATGDIAPAYTLFSGGYKTDFSDSFSAAVIFDQPFGANVEYPVGSIHGTTFADLASNAVTLMVSYDISDRFTVYGGAVMQQLSADAYVFAASTYTVQASAATGYGYVAGAAFQIPDIALRVALTYHSEITTNHDTVEDFGGSNIYSVTEVTTPQSINLEFQTGINPKTLIFGSARWVNWSAFELAPANYPAPLGPLVSYDNDTITYSLGVGRKLSDSLSAAITIGYEASLGGDATVLAPTDGYLSLGGGLTYTVGNAKITAGAKYLWLGDASAPAVGLFTDNTALAFGVSVSLAM